MTDTVGKFTTIDYVVFSCMLGVSVSIGIYHAFAGGKQKTTKEFLLANRDMNPIPVAMSLVASFISAITVLGTPAEMYIYGSMYWLYAFAFFIVGILVIRFIMPMWFRLDITSANEYLELRFNKTVRICALLAFMVQMMISKEIRGLDEKFRVYAELKFLYMGIVIYAPALALNAVTGINLWGSVIATGLVCTFYTTVGGMKAVLWTDVFQMVIMVAGFIAVIIEGCRRLGGMSEMWHIAEKGGRIDFWNFSLDPTIRHTFWTIIIGGTFNWGYTYGVNQAQVQRYLSCGTEKRAQMSLILAVIGMAVVVSLACLSGLTMYAYYAECDPYTLNKVSQSDQLIAYFTLDLFGDFPGLPGLFTSAVFSGALSSVSSGLNALAALTTEDLVKSVWKDLPETRLTWISKGVAMSYGLLAIVLSYVVSLMSGSVLQISLSLFGMIGGPLFGVFTLGMFIPWSNSKGAVCGLVTGLAFTCWIGIGANFFPPDVYKPPLSVEGCDASTINMTTVAMVTNIMESTLVQTSAPLHPITNLYTLSYAYYPAVGWCTTMFIGILVSLLTGAKKPRDLDPILYISVADAMYCCFPESCKKIFRCGIPRYEGSMETKEDTEVLKMTETGLGIEELKNTTLDEDHTYETSIGPD